jgi:ferredoxin--NADP+ reductase
MSGPWVKTRLAHRIDWAEGLITVRLDAQLDSFSAGQFVMLGGVIDEQRIERAYSLASAPNEAPELLLTLIQDGALTPHLFGLHIGEELWVTTRASGQFVLANVKDAPILWMLATGTGIAPYISMLRTEEPWQRFERIVLVHGVRRPEHLVYREEIEARSLARSRRLTWIPLISRAPEMRDVLKGRIPGRLDAIEERVGARIEASTSQVLLCGHPEMIKETRALLEARGLERNRRQRPGQVTAEAFW